MPAADTSGPSDFTQGALTAYRSVGLGIWGALLRYVGMPLEKFALFMNSSQVSGSGQMTQALRLVFKDGWLAPFRVVGPASLTAWFFQYSAMGLVFESVDSTLSKALGVKRMVYGPQLMEPPKPDDARPSARDASLSAAKTVAAPIISGSIESMIANRAEVQRYFGMAKFGELNVPSAFNRMFGTAFAANAARNAVMSSTSFVITPLLYKTLYPQEKKDKTSLFWFGLGMNIFFGNVVAINLQALWGRSLDQLAKEGALNYSKVVRDGLRAEGIAAFITPSKWFSRVLMNAPAQGTLPWFYNDMLPQGEWIVYQALGTHPSATSR